MPTPGTTGSAPATTPAKKAVVTPKVVTAPKKEIPAKEVERVILYPDYATEIYVGDNPLTVEVAKDMIGWQEEGEAEKYKDEYDLVDMKGKKIRLGNNLRNRVFDRQWALSRAQVILNKQFAPEGPNGEAIIIGKTGITISAQHRLIGLIFAGQMWEADEVGGQWKQLWGDTEPYIETFVNYGISENAITINTIDDVRPRTLADSLFASGMWDGKGLSNAAREKLTKMIDNAVKCLWDRLAMKNNSYQKYRTNSEAAEFVKAHKSLARAVKHIYDEEIRKDAEGKNTKGISKYLPLGRVSGLCYLMYACKTDPEVYRNADPRSEDVLDMSMIDKANEFWSLLAAGSGKFILVEKAIKALDNPDTLAKGTVAEKEAIIIQAWKAFSTGKPISDIVLKLKYVGTGDDRTLEETPNIGGIDFAGEAPINPTANDPTPEQIAAAKLEERKARQAEAQAKLRKSQGGGGLQGTEAPTSTTIPAAAAAKKAAAATGTKPASPTPKPATTPTPTNGAAKKPSQPTPAKK
jgi:hypothetical protein